MTERRQIQHAMKYAEALDKIYMLEKYRKYYPHIFNHVDMVTRPATTDDYFVPSNLPCLVVESLRFVDERACNYLGCFPFKTLGEPCTETDEPRLSPLGTTTTLSCQKMCRREKRIDTEWWDDRCVQVNPLKKLVVMFPERVFGRKEMHKYHNGLDWKKGHIALNTQYCQAYGMEFNGYECTMTMAQKIAEVLVGTTVYRSIKTHNLTPVTIPGSVAVDLIYVDDPILPYNPIESTESASELALEIVRDLSIDFGIDIGLHVVSKFLKKRAPKLLVKASTDIGIKHALTQAVLRHSGAALAKGAIHLGKAISVASIVYTAYSIIGIIVDAIDPNMYSYLLTGKMVETLNARLDAQYFQTDDTSYHEVTPEFVWDNLLDLEDQSERIQHMGENINNYLKALRTLPGDVITAPPPKSIPFVTHSRNDTTQWNLTMHFIVLGMLLCLSLYWTEWVHVWSLLVLASIFAFGPQ